MTLAIVWFMLIAFILAVYYVLDGFDLGAGILAPIIAKTQEEKQALVRAVGPVWDGNEVWLLTGGGALFAEFAPAYATAFSGFYLAIMLVLFGLIIRAVSLEFRMHDSAWQNLWDTLFFIGSLVPALLFGVALGNCLQGIPLDAHGDYTGDFFGLLRPFPLLCGLLGLSTIITQGACWLAAKVELNSDLQLRASNVRRIMFVVSVILVALATISFLFITGSNLDIAAPLPFFAVFAILLVVAIVVGFIAAMRSNDWIAFFANSAICVLIMALFACSLFPNLIVSTGPGASISIAGAASSDVALSAMTVIACIGVPLVVVYHILVYRSFRGRIVVEK